MESGGESASQEVGRDAKGMKREPRERRGRTRRGDGRRQRLAWGHSNGELIILTAYLCPSPCLACAHAHTLDNIKNRGTENERIRISVRHTRVCFFLI